MTNKNYWFTFDVKDEVRINISRWHGDWEMEILLYDKELTTNRTIYKPIAISETEAKIAIGNLYAARHSHYNYQADSEKWK